jgi:hypothetical protein
MFVIYHTLWGWNVQAQNWTTDPEKATLFATREDAQRELDSSPAQAGEIVEAVPVDPPHRDGPL